MDNSTQYEGREYVSPFRCRLWRREPKYLAGAGGKGRQPARITLRTSLIFVLLNTAALPASAQDAGPVNWLTFEQLADSLLVKPRPVFVEFYADWCTNCIKMDKVAFQDPAVASLLNEAYYAVRMDVESQDTIYFGKQIFVNERIRKRNPVHQIALLMASRDDQQFSLPAMVVLDENFVATARYFQYLSIEQILEILQRP